MLKTAKLFLNGGSQAVRLPAEFRFDRVSEVYVRRDERTGDVVLSARPAADWAQFVTLRDSIGPVPELEDFLTIRPLNGPDGLRDPFAETP